MTQTVPDISPLMPMHQDPLPVYCIDHDMHVRWQRGGHATSYQGHCLYLGSLLRQSRVQPAWSLSRCFIHTRQWLSLANISLLYPTFDEWRYYPILNKWTHIYSSPSGQNGRQFADNIFKCIFTNKKFSDSIQISLKRVPKCPIGKKSALVQVMAWRRTGDKP